MTNDALLVVDVQNGFINENTCDLPQKIEEIQNGYKTVIALQFINLEGSMFRRELQWDKLSLNTDETELAFTPRSDVIVFPKYAYGITPELLSYLKRNGLTSLDICGLNTNGCVTKICMDLFDNGILPRVLGNYCASTLGQSVHKQALVSLRHIIGVNNVIDG